MSKCTDCSREIKKTHVKYWYFSLDKPREVRCHACYKINKRDDHRRKDIENEILR